MAIRTDKIWKNLEDGKIFVSYSNSSEPFNNSEIILIL